MTASWRHHGSGWRLLTDEAGLIPLWHEKGPHLSFSRGGFERRAPATVDYGSYAPTIDMALLELLTAAYREAASGTVSG